MPESHVYKSVDGCEIRLDIHRPSHPEQSSPAIVFIHGGALINGSKDRASETGIRLFLFLFVVLFLFPFPREFFGKAKKTKNKKPRNPNNFFKQKTKK